MAMKIEFSYHRFQFVCWISSVSPFTRGKKWKKKKKSSKIIIQTYFRIMFTVNIRKKFRKLHLENFLLHFVCQFFLFFFFLSRLTLTFFIFVFLLHAMHFVVSLLFFSIFVFALFQCNFFRYICTCSLHSLSVLLNAIFFKTWLFEGRRKAKRQKHKFM